MHGYFKIVNTVYWLALILWISALISAAVAAMNVFGSLNDMPLELEQYGAYPAAEHPRLAAGRIMEGVFFLVDLLQFIAVPLVAAALIAQVTIFRLSLKRPANTIRTACIVLAAGIFAYHAIMLAPGMNRELRAYWAAAEAGQVEQAHAHRTAFNADHPRADALLRLNLVLLLVAAASSAAAFSPTGGRRAGHLQTPHLARKP